MNPVKKTVEIMMRPLKRRVSLMIGRAVVRLTDDARLMQELQVEGLQDELIDGAEHWLPYGLTAHAPAGSEALLLALGGMRQHPAVAAVSDRRSRPTGLAEGEVMLYTLEHTEEGAHSVHLKNGRIAEIRCGASSIVMTPEKITVTAASVDVVGSQGTWRIP